MAVEKENDISPEGSTEAKANDTSQIQQKKSPIKLITSIVLLISVLFFIWYILSERHTPYTDQARIKGLITPIASRVSGNITDINIQLHSQVKAGDTLFQIDPEPYEIAVLKAEANLDNTVQSVAASTSSVKSAAGRLGVAKAQLDRAQRNWNRVERVMKENAGALSENDIDQAETALLTATEQVASSEANLDRAKQALGDSGPDNPMIRLAIKDIEKAQLDLAFTTIIAPTDGVIESFDLDLGYFASTGQPLTTLISKSDLWIQADLKENNISLMNVGDPIEFTLDIEPGKIYQGTVRSIGFGVATDRPDKGGLPSIDSKTGWLRDPQRFPIIIGLNDTDGSIQKKLRIGGQADIVVYTGTNGLLNALAAFRIRLNSWLSYVR